jgi:hypothetical protein
MKPLFAFTSAEFPIISSVINLADGFRYHATDQLNPSVTGNGTLAIPSQRLSPLQMPFHQPYHLPLSRFESAPFRVVSGDKAYRWAT